jgi:hypothetical protein
MSMSSICQLADGGHPERDWHVDRSARTQKAACDFTIITVFELCYHQANFKSLTDIFSL